jgi:hypothetical protein
VADSAICVGVGLLFVASFQKEPPEAELGPATSANGTQNGPATKG